jgi:hypothetical protein
MGSGTDQPAFPGTSVKLQGHKVGGEFRLEYVKQAVVEIER